MILIACVDDRLGMLFHNRRQSQDRILRERILTLTQNSRLWMNAYSAGQFASAPQITVAEDFLQQAATGEFCFVENVDPALALPRLEKLILYRWNRSYPGDFFLNLPLESWRKTASSDFSGSSHEKITEEIYLP